MVSTKRKMQDGKASRMMYPHQSMDSIMNVTLPQS